MPYNDFSMPAVSEPSPQDGAPPAPATSISAPVTSASSAQDDAANSKRPNKKERRAAKTQAANGGVQPEKPRYRPDGSLILTRKEKADMAAEEAAKMSSGPVPATSQQSGAGTGPNGETSAPPAPMPTSGPTSSSATASGPTNGATTAQPFARGKSTAGRRMGAAESWSTSLLSNVVRPKPDTRQDGILKQIVPHVRYHPSMISLRDRLDPNNAGNDPMGKVHAELNGSNLRAIAVLQAMKEMIRDYRTPPKTLFSRTLIFVVGATIDFLTEVRPLGISVANSIRFLKAEISVLDRDFSDEQSKQSLFRTIDGFIRERIEVPQKVITRLVHSKVKANDTILVFGHSTTVEQALLRIHARHRSQGSSIKVIVVESGPPMHQSKDFVMLLHKAGVQDVTYGHLSALHRLMPRADLVLLGTAAVMADGSLYARAGTSLVAMCGHEFEKPVYALCETYKFSERLQMDALVENEAGHEDEFLPHGTHQLTRSLAYADQPGVLLSRGAKAAWPHLHTLALRYDMTPPQFVSAIVCEAGFFQPDSAPTIMRDYKSILFGV